MKEETFLFGCYNSLVGVVTSPGEFAQAAKRPAIVFLNAGVIHRIGPNRLYVKMARQLAQMGFVSFRFDFSSLGDSKARRDSLGFSEAMVKETQEAMDFLETTCGARKFLLVGVCAGAAVSLKVADNDSRVAGAVLINVRGYQWNRRLKIQAHLRKFLRYYWRVVFYNPQLLSKNLKFGLDRQNASGGENSLLASNKNDSVSQNGMAELRNSAKRGVKLLLVYSEGDIGLDFAHLVLGKNLAALRTNGSLSLEIIPQTDHAFTLLQSQRRLIEVVSVWVNDLFSKPLHRPQRNAQSVMSEI